MFAATVGREMVCDAWVKRGATQIVGDLNWLKREGKEDVTIDMRGKSLPVSTKSLEIRKKYRPVKGLRKKLKNSSPGTSVLYVNGKDIAKAKKLAEGRGLKFTHTGTHSSGLDRIKLMGDDKAIEDIAKEFGRRRIKSLLAHGKSDIRQWWGSLRTELERALGPNMVHNPDEILDDYFGDAEGMQQQGKTPQQAAEEIAKRAGKSLPGKRGKGQSWWYNAVLTALGPLLGYDPHDIWDEYEDELEGMQQEGKTPQDAAKEIAKKAGKSLKDKKTKGRWMSPTHNVYHGDHQVGKTQANSDEEALEFAEGKWGEGVTVERIKKSFKGSKDISHNMHRMQVGDRVKFDDGPYAGKVGSVSKVGYTTVDVKLDGDGTVLAADTEDLSYQLQRGITVKGMEHKKKSWWWEAVKQALCVALGVGVGYASGSDALGIGTTAGCSTVMWKNERELEEMEEDGVSPQEAANKIAKKAKKSLMGSKNGR
jgi:transcription antitermination factor NusG